VSPVASSWGAIALLFGVQQAITLTRVGLRVSLVDAEFRYALRLAPTASAESTPTSAPPIAAAVDEHATELTDLAPQAEGDPVASASSSVDAQPTVASGQSLRE
jgi:hypothetical protein